MSSSCLHPSDPQLWNAGALSLYQRLLPASFWDHLCRQNDLHQNNRVYTLAVVVWLMISQWVQGHTPLDRAVSELLHGLPASFWPNPCKRLLDCQNNQASLSGNTAAYNTARQQLPSVVVESCCDHIFQQLTAETRGYLPSLDRPAFIFDRTSVELPPTEAASALPPRIESTHLRIGPCCACRWNTICKPGSLYALNGDH